MSSRQSFIFLLSLHLLATAFLATLATPVWGQAPPDPELRLSPPSGPGGIAIAASVIGFGDDCAVRIHFDTTTNDALAIAALQSGRGSAGVSIPVDAAVGPHVVIALGLVPDAAGECTAASGKRAEAPFQVEQQRPRLSVDLDDTTPGATLQIHGSGFCGEPGCSPVTIYIDGLTASDDLTVASDGTFSGEAMVPAADPVGDDIPIVAVQTDADGNEIQAHSSFSSSNRPPTDEILPDPEDDPNPPIPSPMILGSEDDSSFPDERRRHLCGLSFIIIKPPEREAVRVDEGRPKTRSSTGDASGSIANGFIRWTT